MSEVFYSKKINILPKPYNMFVLGCKNNNMNIEAWISDLGANLCRLIVNNKHIIDFDPELLLNGDYTGTPILYPTPNRVRNGFFSYNGQKYYQQKNGETIFEHGLVHDEQWCFEKPVISSENVHISFYLDIDVKSPLFEAFPFKHRILVSFKVYHTGLEIEYNIKNEDNVTIPYGFGLHPYFQKLNDIVKVSIPAESVMDNTSDLLPTGRLIDVTGTIYDLRKGVMVSEVDFDHVFTSLDNNHPAILEYDDLIIKMSASKDFSHIVIYSPINETFFCLEHQTCSTDAHNLYSRNFIIESGLKFVLPDNNASGRVHYQFDLK